MTDFVKTDFAKLSADQHKMPLSHQQLTAHLIGKHQNDVCEIVAGLIKDFHICEPKDRVKIALSLFPYFLVKSELAVSTNMMETLSREMQELGGFKPHQLKEFKDLVLKFKEENIKEKENK